MLQARSVLALTPFALFLLAALSPQAANAQNNPAELTVELGDVSLTKLPFIMAEYWPHIVNEDFMLNFFVDLEFLLGELPDGVERNLLCVFRNPVSEPPLPGASLNFEILGYDLVDVQASASALTNCGGFPEVFENSELSSKGLLTSCSRALEVQSELRRRYPEEAHANCHVWAILRAQSRTSFST